MNMHRPGNEPTPDEAYRSFVGGDVLDFPTPEASMTREQMLEEENALLRNQLAELGELKAMISELQITVTRQSETIRELQEKLNDKAVQHDPKSLEPQPESKPDGGEVIIPAAEDISVEDNARLDAEEAYDGEEPPKGPRFPSLLKNWKAAVTIAALAIVGNVATALMIYGGVKDRLPEEPIAQKPVVAANQADLNMDEAHTAHGEFSTLAALSGVEDARSEAYRDTTRKWFDGKKVMFNANRGYDATLVERAQNEVEAFANLTPEQKADFKELYGADQVKATQDFAKKIVAENEAETNALHTAIGKATPLTGLENRVFTDSPQKKAEAMKIQAQSIEGEDDREVKIQQSLLEADAGISKSVRKDFNKHYGKRFLQNSRSEALQTLERHADKAKTFHQAFAEWYPFTGLSNEAFTDSSAKKSDFIRIVEASKSGNFTEQLARAEKVRPAFDRLSRKQREGVYKMLGQGNLGEGKREVAKVLAAADKFIADHKN